MNVALARVLKSRLLHRLTLVVLLIGLAGCTPSLAATPLVELTVPPSTSADSYSVLTSQPTPVSVVSELADSPIEALPLVESPVFNRSRPALLAGEPAREFERGVASWYGADFHGRRTASGERYDMHAFTAAHRTLPFGTMVRVHSLVNGREVDVRITDRGPFSHGRVIDVSRAAAQELGVLGLGFKQVVLLVPESTQPVVEVLLRPARKTRRISGRPSPAHSKQ